MVFDLLIGSVMIVSVLLTATEFALFVDRKLAGISEVEPIEIEWFEDSELTQFIEEGLAEFAPSPIEVEEIEVELVEQVEEVEIVPAVEEVEMIEPVTEIVEAIGSSEALAAKTVPQLKVIAKARNIKGASKMNKAKLIAALA